MRKGRYILSPTNLIIFKNNCLLHQTKCPAFLRKSWGFFRPLLEASFDRVHKKSPARSAELFCLCPGLDSNQHILANAAT